MRFAMAVSASSTRDAGGDIERSEGTIRLVYG